MHIAIDFGASKGRVEAYETLSSLVPLERIVFDVSRHYKTDLKQIGHACTQLHYKLGKRIESVGLAIAGRPDATRQRLTFSGNLADHVDKPLKADLEQLLGCRVVIGNDAEALALAEAVYGHCASDGLYPQRDFLGIIWGTGVGGATVRYASDGTYFTTPGEPGHMVVEATNPALCGCGQFGDVEALCGGGNFVKQYGKEWFDLSDEDWVTIESYMLIGLENYLRVQPVDLLVFSGSVACGQAQILASLQESLDHPAFGSPKLIISKFGESAGTLGALSLLSL